MDATGIDARSFRAPSWQSADRLFVVVLLASLVVHFGIAAIILLTPKQPERELGLQEMVDRFAKLSALPPPAKTKKPKATPDEKRLDTGNAKTASSGSAAPAADPEQTRALVQKSGLLKILTSKGANGGALADVLGDSTATADIGQALAGARGVGVATSDVVAGHGQKGANTGAVAGIGQIGTQGGGNVNLGAKNDSEVRGTVSEAAPQLEGSSVDVTQLSRFVSQRKSAIQACYEKELKRNPTLKGRIVVRFVISPQGRATEIDIEENTMGNEAVAACIRNVVRVWTFPFKPEDGAAVAYPFVFSPAS